jgi:hypothetical protein
MSSSISRSETPASLATLSWRAIGFLAVAMAAVAVTWLLYAAAAMIFLDQAVMLRGTREMLDAKLARLDVSGRPAHVIVVSGSNALYSVDSPALARATGMPVTNVAMQWSYAAYALERVVERLRTGDVVLLPLEYEFFTEIDQRTPLEACYLITQDRRTLTSVGRFLSALVECSPYVMFEGLRQQLLLKLGLPFPSVDIGKIITPEGDMIENVATGAIWQPKATDPIVQLPQNRPFGHDRIANAIRNAVTRDASVFLSYPVGPIKDGRSLRLGQGWTEAYQAWARMAGAHVISSPTDHQFDAGCFYDSNYHLHRGCTARNSQVYADALKPFLPFNADKP